MNILDSLMGEHAAVKGLLAHIDSDPTNDSLLDLAADLLDSHAKIEEELLYSGGAKEALTQEETAEMLVEHQNIKNMLSKAKNANTKILRQSRVKEFSKILKDHLKDEETKIFPKISKNSNDSLLDQLETRWAKFRKVGN